MGGLLDAALANPWRTLETVLDGPLHPGGIEATVRLLDRADVGSGTRLLDVGCGAGDALTVARERGADTVGVDPDPLPDTDLSVALGEAHRVLKSGGRLALSDVVVDGDRPAVPDRVAEALYLDGARTRDRLTMQLADAGFDVQVVYDHHDDLLAMRDRVTDRVDYDGILGLMGERGQRALDAIEELETAIEAGHVSYVSVVAIA